MHSTVPENLSIKRGIPGLVGRRIQTVGTRRSGGGTNGIHAKSEMGHSSLAQQRIEVGAEGRSRSPKRAEKKDPTLCFFSLLLFSSAAGAMVGSDCSLVLPVTLPHFFVASDPPCFTLMTPKTGFPFSPSLINSMDGHEFCSRILTPFFLVSLRFSYGRTPVHSIQPRKKGAR